MPEHVHLLVSEPPNGTLARALQALKLSVAVQSRERPFWQRRYYDFNVHSEQKRVEKLRYMHRNPVIRGLVAKPEDWKWSSFRHYANGLEGTVEIESFWTAARRGGLPDILRLSRRSHHPTSQKRDVGAPKMRCGSPAWHDQYWNSQAYDYYKNTATWLRWRLTSGCRKRFE